MNVFLALNDLVNNTIVNVEKSYQTNETNNNLGSGGESLASEDESSFDNFDSININFMDDDDFDFNYMSNKPKLNKLYRKYYLLFKPTHKNISAVTYFTNVPLLGKEYHFT